MRKVVFDSEAFKQFSQWAIEDKKTFKKLADLIKETARNPFEGKGKPEALKHDKKGFWSRRISQEHRLVYKVSDDSITIISCRFHYE